MIAQVLGEGLPLVVIHGFGVDDRIMLPLEDAIEESGWQRIYLDLPWTEGNADSSNTTSADHVAQGALDDIQ
ncbi:lipase family protein [Arthrobacter sp. TmT3-37]